MIEFKLEISDEDLSALLSYYDEFEEVFTEKAEWLLNNICFQEGYHDPESLTDKQKYKIAKKNRSYKIGRKKKDKVKKDKDKEKKAKPPSDEAWRLK